MFIGKARSHEGENLQKAVSRVWDRLVNIAYSLGAVLKDTVLLPQGFLTGSLYFTLLRNIPFVEDAAQLSFSSKTCCRDRRINFGWYLLTFVPTVPRIKCKHSLVTAFSFPKTAILLPYTDMVYRSETNLKSVRVNFIFKVNTPLNRK